MRVINDSPSTFDDEHDDIQIWLDKYDSAGILVTSMVSIQQFVPTINEHMLLRIWNHVKTLKVVTASHHSKKSNIAPNF